MNKSAAPHVGGASPPKDAAVGDRGERAQSPWQMPWKAWRDVAVRSWNESTSDNIGLISAGVAFYGFLAVLPMLAATVLSYGIFVEPPTVIRHVQALTAILPEAAAISVGEQLLQLTASPDERKGLGVLISLGIALFGARNGAAAVITALNIAYEEDEKRGFIKLTLTAIALTAAAVVGAIIAATAITLVASAERRMPEMGPVMHFVSSVLTYGLLTLAGAGAAAVLYRFGPSRRPARWTWLSPGALFTAIGWLVLTFGFGAYAQYIGKFDATYGSLGAIVALLTWLYLASYVLLLGAEINSELEHQTEHDSTVGPTQPVGARKAWVADHVAGADVDAPSQAVAEKVAAKAPAPPASVRSEASSPVDDGKPPVDDGKPNVAAGLVTLALAGGAIVATLSRLGGSASSANNESRRAKT